MKQARKYKSAVLQRIMDKMEKDHWWVKLKRWIKIEWWVFVCSTRKYWDKEFINRRNHIAHWNIRRGTILKVFPGERSESKKPYKVMVIYSTNDQFITELCNPVPGQHLRHFYYDSYEWKTYHHNRFQIVKY
jgi:hypothetical protein